MASGKAPLSAGPNLPQAQAHVVEGKFGSPRVTLELTPPRGEAALAIHAAAHVQSSNPPQPNIKYHIDVSTDGGKTWTPLVKDWSIPRRGDEPKEFWSQSFCWGAHEFGTPTAGPVRVRFHNTGGKNYPRCEAHLVYRPSPQDATKVTFAWTDDKGEHRTSHTFASAAKEAAWVIPTGNSAVTHWVEFTPAPGRKQTDRRR